jgi:hypothetical protein
MYGSGHLYVLFMRLFTDRGSHRGDGVIIPVGGDHGDRLHGMYGIRSIALIMRIVQLCIRIE